MLWPLFYAPWAITLVSPTLGFVVSTFVVVYHYTFKHEIIQRVEMTMLPGPQLIPRRIIERYITNAEPHDESQAAEKPGKGEKKVGENVKSTEESSHPEGETQGKAAEEEVKVLKKLRKSPYIWELSEWGKGL